MGVSNAIDLTPGQRKELLGLLSRHLPGVAVWAFGSRVKWTARPDSDLDLVVFSTPEQKDRVAALKEAIEESSLPFRVDLLVWDEIPESFQENIRQAYVSLVEKSEGKSSSAGMSEWHTTPLGELTINHDGKRRPVKESDREPGPYPYYGASGIVDYVSAYLIDGDYLLIAEDGENLRTRQTPIAFMSRGKSWVNNHAHIVTGNERADTRFLMYAIQAQDVSPYLTGAVMPKLTQGNLNKIPITHPEEVEDQRAIAHILGTLDDKIELNRRMNETLEAMAQVIFKSWFVDFDPVRAKASGEPHESICRRLGLTPDLLALFPDSFQDSELGEIPNGWSVRRLDDVADFLNGLALQKYPATGGEWLPVIKIAQLRAGHTLGADRANTEIPPAYVIENGDVLFSWSGSLEVEVWCGGRGALNQHLFKVTSAEFPKWFYFLWTRHHLQGFRDIAANKATTMGHIQRKHLTDAEVLCPSEKLLAAMGATIDLLISKIINGRLEVNELAAVRDTLLPKLLSGELSANREDKLSQ